MKMLSGHPQVLALAVLAGAMFSVAALVASLFVGSGRKVHAATTPAPIAAAVQAADQTSEHGGYWAMWSEAASH